MKTRYFYRAYLKGKIEATYKMWEIDIFAYTPYSPDDERKGGFFRRYATASPIFAIEAQTDDTRGHTLRNTYAWKAKRAEFTPEALAALKAFTNANTDGPRGIVAALKTLKATRVDFVTTDNGERRYIPRRYWKKATQYATTIDAGIAIPE